LALSDFFVKVGHFALIFESRSTGEKSVSEK